MARGALPIAAFIAARISAIRRANPGHALALFSAERAVGCRIGRYFGRERQDKGSKMHSRISSGRPVGRVFAALIASAVAIAIAPAAFAQTPPAAAPAAPAAKPAAPKP